MKISAITPEMAWQLVRLFNRKEIQSATQRKTYRLRFSKDILYLKAESRNQGEEELISKNEFTTAFASIAKLPSINTNLIKHVIPKSLYRKRSPLIAILYAAGILVK